MTTTPLHDNSYPPSPAERTIFDRAYNSLSKGSTEVLPLDELVTEMVLLGIQTRERARLVAMAHFMPGGVPEARLAWLVAQNWKLSTGDLVAAVRKHLRDVTIQEPQAECQRQGELATAQADALEAETMRRDNPAL
jgi:hypothetical protein